MKSLYIIFIFFISFLSFSNPTPLQKIIHKENRSTPKRFYPHKHYTFTEVFHNYKNKHDLD